MDFPQKFLKKDSRSVLLNRNWTRVKLQATCAISILLVATFLKNKGKK